ncbi:MAG: cadherin-like beta sandwich domain-containing protein, partial [Acidobacteria bacterium]|nr:cadherin-like beta sandwich domain-containing protein [Acidobacteriota bacterium]
MSSLRSRSLTLRVGSSTQLAFSDDVDNVIHNNNLAWSNTGLSWSAGDTVSLSLVGPPPTDPPTDPPTSWEGYALTLSADRVPSEKGDDVIVTLDLGQPAGPGFFAWVEGLPAGTASYGIDERVPERKREDVRNGMDWTFFGSVQLVGKELNAPPETLRLQKLLRDWNGAQTKTVRLRIIDDPWVDPDETIVLRATGANVNSDGKTPGTGFGYSELNSNDLTLTIADDESSGAADAPLEVGVLDAVTYETGTGATTSVPVTVWLDRPATHDVTVDYATADGSARSDGTTAAGTKDYTAKSGTVTIPAGETRVEVTVDVLDDTVEDSGEVFRFKLSNPSPSTVRLARAEATVTIRNDELRLADLEIEGGPDPRGPWTRLDIGAFSRDRTDYAVTVPYATTHAHLRATPVDERAAVLATGSGSDLAAVRAGRWGEAVALEVGGNTLVVTATGPTGEVNTYRVTVTREAWAASSNADLEALLVQAGSNAAGPWTKLDIGAFDAETTQYAVTVPHATTVARVLATPADAGAKHSSGAGSDLAEARPGFWSRGLPLAVGDNALSVEVTAEDGTIKTYTVTVTREARTLSSSADLSGLTAEAGTDGNWSALDIGAFAAGTTSYSATVPYAVTDARMTAT